MRIRPLLLLALCLAASCARTSGTVEIPPEELPFAVARGSVPTVSASPTQALSIYLVRDGRLVRADRRAAAHLTAPEAGLRALIEGPTARELRGGVFSLLPSSVRLLAFGVDSGTAFVDLGGGLQEPAAPEAIVLRVAQIVWTLTESTDIVAVRFAVDGEAVAVTTDAQVVADRPVTRADYATVGPSSS